MMMKRAVVPAILLLCTSFAPAQQRILGFSAARAASQHQIEDRLKASISAQEIQKHHRYFTAEPHPAGSERNNQLARHIADLWQQQGWEDVVIHRYDVLNTSPRSVTLEMLAPVHYAASLREQPYAVDPDTKNPAVSSAWLGLSASGEVTAPVVYAHSGNPEDYELLRQHGIDVHGKVVLVRYSNPYSYRGFKALTAEQEGAAAILIYSDPAEDGYQRGKVFPNGPWGPESHFQRGSLTYDFMVPGDPLTPGWASLPDAPRIPLAEARSVPKIIGIPLSWQDAEPLLRNMDGPVAPKSWQGGLPIKYRLGGNRVRIHLKVDMDNSVRPNYVVEARIRGTEFPDELVVLGNHRDAWVFGGVDPSSGTASMMELSRALGELKKQGMRPRRTMVICSWDGEEVGLTGSTEWGEQFADELRKNQVAYLNVDSSASGPDLSASGVPSLAAMMVQASHAFQDPSGKPLYAAWRASIARKRREQHQRGVITDMDLFDTKVGSGSDHTVFLNFLGRPVMLLEFDGPYGVYHSVYDDYYWINHIGDPGYRYHALLAKLWGVLALRLANADILPFDFASYAGQLRQYVRALEQEPNLRQSPAALDRKPLLARIGEFEAAGRTLNGAIEKRLAEGKLDPATLDEVNRGLMQVEGNWLNPEGIPGRPWFQHLIYAARYTYAHLELPGITEAVEKPDWETARQQTKLLEDAVARNTALLSRLAQRLNAR
jgi:N-acetylated-alpha-linked acidic dipeptidase